MNRIRLLPDHVANQIAAGEVVERPASVVKELVENALDAGAGRVTVEIQAGGRGLIRVTDDGAGMSRDDALLSLERHATSKIQRAEDLAAVATMGFRGEALPSIASVSRFTLATRERDADPPEGVQIVVNGGKIAGVSAAGRAPGTTIEARQLFFNLPARRKFLRSEETESAHVQHYVALAALAFPEVAFTFLKDGRVVWQLPAASGGAGAAGQLGALRERLRTVLGGEERLLAVDFAGALTAPVEDGEQAAGALALDGGPPRESGTAPAPQMRVWGFLGAPGVSRATRENQHLFVNRRPVDNRGLNHALLEGYHTALMKGRYPVCCLFVEIDPALVDVNVHPAKREVRFHREFEVRRVMTNAVRRTLLRFHAAPPHPSAPPSAAKPPLPNPEPLRPSMAPPAGVATATPPPGTPAHAPSAASAAARVFTPREPIPPRPTDTLPPPSSSPPPPSVPLLQVPLRLVGVIGRLYVVLESDRGLVLLDQHAAHERILFERMLARVEHGGQAPSQKLLLPETLELGARDAAFLRQNLATLARLGVGLEEFGERTFLLDALPPFVNASDARRFALKLVDELKAAGQEVNAARLGEHVVAKTVCRHAVKANDPLAGRELENLVADLRRCAMPYTCPHGRPTLVEMSWRELERKFGRTQ